MIKARTVMFDLDGTLVDSVPDLAWSVDSMCRDLGLPERGPNAVRDWVGNGVRMLIRRAIAGSITPCPDSDAVDEALQIYHGYYVSHCCVDSRLYPTVLDSLAVFKSRGAKLALITNKPAVFTELTLEHFGLTPYFDRVFSYETLPRAKPDPMPLLQGMDDLGRPGVFIGDSATDVEAARAAGIPVLCMSYGYNHGQPVSQLSPDGVFDLLRECLNIIEII